MTLNSEHASTSRVVSVVSIPGYQIRTVLGKGGMATVYLAVQESINREVALKILAPDHSDESFSERFVREARIISKLTHPNIVTIFDAGVHREFNYIAMEYIPGRNLIEAHDDLSFQQKINAIKQIALALDYAGKKGYVHRDIKPENIMLADDGRAILTDFGIARGHDIESGLTLTGKAIGTPYFMSPEQTKGQPVDHRSDIYSLGIVLFQTLTGYVPYDGPSIVAIGIKHISAPVPALPRFMEQLQPIINRCLAKDPAQRYQTALELHDALAAISEAELDYITAKSRAVARYNTGIHHAHTLHDNASVAIPVDQRVSRYAELSRPFRQSAPPNTQQRVTQPRSSRRRLFWLLLLIAGTAGLLAYHQRNDLLLLWQMHAKPLLAKYLDDGPQPSAVTIPEQALPASATPVPKTSAVTSDSPVHDEPALADVRLQIRLLRDKLLINPGDTRLVQELDTLKTWYHASLELALQRKDTIKAQQLLRAYQDDYPDAGQEYFTALEQRILATEQLLSHLQQARVYMAANAIDRPDGANALEEYLAARRLAPQDDEVAAGLTEIAKYFHDKAQQARHESRLTDALDYLNSGLRATPEAATLKTLQQEITTALRHQQEYAALVQEADALLKQGQVITPASRNAYGLYRSVIDKDPGNKGAQAGLDQVENWFVGQIRQLYDKQEFFAARELLTTAHDYFPHSTRYQSLRNEIEAAIDATYPKISKVLFSPQAISSMQSAATLDKLNPGQTLYGGFTYKNFFDTGSLMEIRLMDQDGQLEYDRKTFSLNTREGDMFFELRLPQSDNAAGNYSVEFFLNDVRILKANLRGLH